ncbi:MAG: 30S ribosomal protein S9 [Candidatus Woykebacteria bacterium]
MLRKKTPPEEVVEEKAEKTKEVVKKSDAKKAEFFQGTGRRKEAVARVRLFLKKGELLINEKPIDDYFPDAVAKKIYEEPLRVVNRLGQLSGTIKIEGGGKNGQIGAVSLGIARALVDLDESFRPILSRKNLLSRDPRVKERRKFGHAGKARKMKQSPKR